MKRLKKWSVRALVALALVTALGRAVLLLLPLPARLRAAPSVVVEYSNGDVAHVFLTDDDQYRMQVELEHVDPAYLAALVQLEDRRFWHHPGVDPLATARAIRQNLSAGRVVSGSSTLTMQLVRMLEPRPRTLRSKLVEMVRALQLEARLGKRQILAAYLQFLPFGRNFEGVETASWAYFGHSARALSPSEIATLLAVPQDPVHRFPDSKNGERLRVARDRAAERLGLRDVASEPIARSLKPLPREIAHAAEWMRAQQPGVARIRTTLDGGLQRLAERMLEAGRQERERNGIYNGTLVLVDHARGEVRALVGNVDYWDAQHGGQLAGFAQPRSTGSLLKPFLYALALDEGLALPSFLVPDVRTHYGLYEPHNFDGGHAGLVRLDDALVRSLNVPFVALLSRLGVERFIGALRTAGVESLDDDEGHYGLSAIVGGIEMTPLEAAGLFSMLAEGGSYRPLTWRASARAAGPVRIFSTAAARLTQQALERRDRPDFPDRQKVAAQPVAIHWKTGTSGRRRDAWSAGSGPTYTAVVWLGNFDNRPSAALVGADAAAPILFNVLEALERSPAPPVEVAGLAPIEVCAFSGYPATPDCPKRAQVLGPVHSVPTASCPFHVALDIDAVSGLALKPECRAGHRFDRHVFVVLPPGVERQADARPRPAWAPGCEPDEPAAPFDITSPREGAALLLMEGGRRQQIPLEVDGGPIGQVSWFVDGEFLGSRAAREQLWWRPTPGAHDIVALEESGRMARRTLSVKQAGF
jgi:penicillin-binding protein 1C